jgi:hypothetical protein
MVYITIKINTIKMLNSESIVIIRIMGEHLLYSKIYGGMIGYGWGNVCYIVNIPPGEYLLYSKVSGGKVYYIANIPRGNVYYILYSKHSGGRFAMRKVYYTTPELIFKSRVLHHTFPHS